MIQANSETAHESLVELLPWYVNGTLAGPEHDAVQKHLGDCAECLANVDMLSRVRRSVRDDSPAPLVPQPRAETLLGALDAAEQDTLNHAHWKQYAAAAVVVLIAAAWFSLQPNTTTDGTPTTFETVTSNGVDSPISYVIDLRFEPGTSGDDRNAALASIGTESTALARSDGSYRITLGPGPASLAEMERRIHAIESLPEVAAARVVAVQLPVE